LEAAIEHFAELYQAPQRLKLVPPAGAPDDPELQRLGQRVHEQELSSRDAVTQTHAALDRFWAARKK
jgi:hypothetical protein